MGYWTPNFSQIFLKIKIDREILNMDLGEDYNCRGYKIKTIRPELVVRA